MSSYFAYWIDEVAVAALKNTNRQITLNTADLIQCVCANNTGTWK